MRKTPIEALQDFDFTVNTHKNATMKTIVSKYDPNAPLIRAKSNYAKDKYNESERKEEARAIMNMAVRQSEIRRLRSEKEALITNEKLVSFVGEVPTPTEEKQKINKNGSEKNE